MINGSLIQKLPTMFATLWNDSNKVVTSVKDKED